MSSRATRGKAAQQQAHRTRWPALARGAVVWHGTGTGCRCLACTGTGCRCLALHSTGRRRLALRWHGQGQGTHGNSPGCGCLSQRGACRQYKRLRFHNCFSPEKLRIMVALTRRRKMCLASFLALLEAPESIQIGHARPMFRQRSAFSHIKQNNSLDLSSTETHSNREKSLSRRKKEKKNQRLLFRDLTGKKDRIFSFSTVPLLGGPPFHFIFFFLSETSGSAD